VTSCYASRLLLPPTYPAPLARLQEPHSALFGGTDEESNLQARHVVDVGRPRTAVLTRPPVAVQAPVVCTIERHPGVRCVDRLGVDAGPSPSGIGRSLSRLYTANAGPFSALSVIDCGAPSGAENAEFLSASELGCGVSSATYSTGSRCRRARSSW
jgi:hypothetical protein